MAGGLGSTGARFGGRGFGLGSTGVSVPVSRGFRSIPGGSATGGGVRFVYNPAATAQLAATLAMVELLREKADESAEYSRSIAPVDTGEYRDSISAEAGIVRGMAAGRVNAWKFTAGWLEFGTSDTPIFAPLRRGAEGAGLRFVSSR